VAIGTAAAIMGGGALLGGIAGAMGQKTSYESGVKLDPAGWEEKEGNRLQVGHLKNLEKMVQASGGTADVAAARGAGMDFAGMLKQYSEGGNLPTDADIASAGGFAQKLFAGQRTAMEQNFADQQTQANRIAAQMNRAGNDPILRAKLAQEQTRQAALLDANQGSWAMQHAMNQPGQRLAFAGQRADVLGGLASQALSNRQALVNMGRQLKLDRESFRLQTAKRYGSQESGGGVGGAIQGALGGAGMGASVMGMMGGGGGGGGGGSFSVPTANMGSFFGGLNPYGPGGGGLSMPTPAPSSGFGGSFQMSNQFTGAPRTFSLGTQFGGQ